MRERGGACQDGSEAARPGDTRLLFKRSPRNESEPSKLLESDVSLGTFHVVPWLEKSRRHMYVGKGPAAWKALPEKGDRQAIVLQTSGRKLKLFSSSLKESTAGYTGTAFRDSPHNRAAVLRPKKLKRRGRQACHPARQGAP